MLRLITLFATSVALTGCFDSDTNDLPEPPAINQPPVAADAQFTTQTEVVINAQLNGSDAEGDNLIFALGNDAENGSVNVMSDGSFSYTPKNEFTGLDSFTFTVTDSQGAGGVGNVSITIDLLTVAISDLVRNAFAQAGSAPPLRVNGRDIINDVAEPTAFDDLLTGQP